VGEEYRSLSSSLWSYLHSPVTSSRCTPLKGIFHISRPSSIELSTWGYHVTILTNSEFR
jgi:hypothetical protein